MTGPGDYGPPGSGPPDHGAPDCSEPYFGEPDFGEPDFGEPDFVIGEPDRRHRATSPQHGTSSSEEDLLDGHRHGGRPRRTWRVAAAVVTAAVLTLVAVRVLPRHSGAQRASTSTPQSATGTWQAVAPLAAAPSPTPAGGSASQARPNGLSRPTANVRVEHLPDRHGSLRNDVEVEIPNSLGPVPGCPGLSELSRGVTCAQSAGLPAAVTAALRDRYPGFTLTSARSARLDGPRQWAPRLWSRELVAQRGRERIVVAVERSTSPGPFAAVEGDDGSHVIELAVYGGVGMTVSVQVSAPSGTELSLSDADALAHDPRLVDPA